MNQSGFIYGGDYNPEQWLAMPEILDQEKTPSVTSLICASFIYFDEQRKENEHEPEWIYLWRGL